MTESNEPRELLERGVVIAAITPTLDAFVASAAPTLRQCADVVYEQLLYSVQDYLRENAEWNIGNEIDRCRKIEAENRELRAELEARTATKATSAAEVAELREALAFYADPDGDGYDVMVKDYGLSTEEGDIIRDRGERARALLAKHQQGEG